MSTVTNNASNTLNFGSNATISNVNIHYCTYEVGNSFFILQNDYMSIEKLSVSQIGTYYMLQDQIWSLIKPFVPTSTP